MKTEIPQGFYYRDSDHAYFMDGGLTNLKVFASISQWHSIYARSAKNSSIDQVIELQGVVQENVRRNGTQLLEQANLKREQVSTKNARFAVKKNTYIQGRFRQRVACIVLPSVETPTLRFGMRFVAKKIIHGKAEGFYFLGMCTFLARITRTKIQVGMSQNIVLLWKRYLEGILREMKKYTTEMESKPIIALAI